MDIQYQDKLIKIYFYCFHGLFLILGITGFIKQRPNLFVIYMVLGMPVFFYIVSGLFIEV